MALNVPEKWFWPAKTRKNWNFLRCIHVFDLVLNYCSDIWGKLATSSILFHCTVGYIFLGFRNEFFILCFRFQIEFFRIPMSRKCLQLDSKSDLTTNGLILEFFVGIRLFLLTSWMHGMKLAWNARMWFSFVDIKYFRWLVWGVFLSLL